MLSRYLVLLTSVLTLFLTVGCGGGSGGTEGDANDPAKTADDDTQMQDETGSDLEGAVEE